MSLSTGVSSTSITPLTPRPVIFAVGDSLTQHASDTRDAGWVALMQHRYNRSADVLPRGLSGYNTKWFIKAALPVIASELSVQAHAVSLITLWLGANDAALSDGVAARQHVPVDAYKKNLATIVQRFHRSAPNANILLITPPHVDDAARRTLSTDGRAERTNAAVGEYARACVEAGAQLSVPVLDLYSFFNAMPESDRAACLDDGLHFSERGNRFVDEQLQKKINECFPEVVEKLEAWQLPDFHIWMNG